MESVSCKATQEGNGNKEIKSESGIVYKLSDDRDSYIVSQCDNYDVENVVIPSVYEGKPIIKIAVAAFEHCRSISSIEIGDNIASIELGAFVYNENGEIEEWE